MDVTHFFSIIIPTYNRPKQLKNCLLSLTKLDYPPELFEIIVIDDGSEKPLETIIKPFQELLNLTLISQKNSGPAIARNTGVNYANGEFLVFTDDDCLVDTNWLNAFSKKLKQNPDCLVGGCIENELINNPYSTASQALLDYLYLTHQDKEEFPPFFTSNNMALSKELFIKIEGFNINYPLPAAEDREFCDRLISKGHNIIYEPKAIVYHAHDLTFTTFFKQHFNYGKGAYLFKENYRQTNNDKNSIRSLSFYGKLLIYPFHKKYNQPAFILFLLFSLSQFATTLGFINQSLSNKENE